MQEAPAQVLLWDCLLSALQPLVPEEAFAEQSLQPSNQPRHRTSSVQMETTPALPSDTGIAEDSADGWQDGFTALFESEGSEADEDDLLRPSSLLFHDNDEEEEYGEEFEEALAEAAQDRYYNVEARQATGSSLYLACRVGDLTRVRQLIDDGADVNKRDLWDSVPLYYTCLAGHLEVAQCLLDNGAMCSEFTFDGERCTYVALTPALRELLGQYKQKPPPLGPLAMSLRPISPMGADPEQASTSQPELAPGMYSDVSFQLQHERVHLHRAILAARCPLFRHKFRHEWKGGSTSMPRTVVLDSPQLSSKALHAVLNYLYTERLDADMAVIEAVQSMVHKCRLKALEAAISAELRTFRLNFKTAKKERAPRRFTLQPGALPVDARLGTQLGALRKSAQELERRGCFEPRVSDQADVLVVVDDRHFRCHCCIIASRSDFFRALLEQPRPRRAGPRSRTDLPREFMEARAAEELFDAADRLLLFAMKRHVAEAIAAALDPSPALPEDVDHICRLLLAADRYEVAHLRAFCLHRLALMFERLSSTTANAKSRAIFEAFVMAVAPCASSDIAVLLGSESLASSSAAVRGTADPDEGPRGEGQGTLLQDLRESFLQEFGGRGAARARRAGAFDFRLQQVAIRALHASLDEGG